MSASFFVQKKAPATKSKCFRATTNRCHYIIDNLQNGKLYFYCNISTYIHKKKFHILDGISSFFILVNYPFTRTLQVVKSGCSIFTSSLWKMTVHGFVVFALTSKPSNVNCPSAMTSF